MGAVLKRMMQMLYTRNLEVVLVGLENSGKTTLLNVIGGCACRDCTHDWPECEDDKAWWGPDEVLGLRGQSQYRQEWGRYTRGCDVILFVVDTNAFHLFPDAKAELHRLLEDRELNNTPLLVVANKIDLEPHAPEETLIKELNLDYITENPWIIIPCSALKTININEVLDWLIKHSSP